jgi:hypothetical protein
MPVYRYQLTGIDVEDLKTQVPTADAPSITGGPIAATIVWDVTAPATSKPDLDVYFTTRGWTFVSQDPVDTPAEESAAQVDHADLLGLTTGDDHTHYQKESEKDAPSGYAGLEADSTIGDTRHGARSGGTQHAVATTVVAGFLSAADKLKLDGIPPGGGGVPATRTLTAGAGQTGGGDLSADRTFDVAAHADGSIVVNADDVQVGVLATDVQHGVRGGGTQHAVATTLVAGFMSAADKAALDGSVSSVGHKALRHLIHFIDSGPAGGFATGAFKERLPLADPFYTSEIWWESAAKLEKVVELTITRNSEQRPTSEVWKMYDTDGSTVLETITDAIAYSGPFETSRTRTIV